MQATLFLNKFLQSLRVNSVGTPASPSVVGSKEKGKSVALPSVSGVSLQHPSSNWLISTSSDDLRFDSFKKSPPGIYVPFRQIKVYCDLQPVEEDCDALLEEVCNVASSLSETVIPIIGSAVTFPSDAFCFTTNSDRNVLLKLSIPRRRNRSQFNSPEDDFDPSDFFQIIAYHLFFHARLSGDLIVSPTPSENFPLTLKLILRVSVLESSLQGQLGFDILRTQFQFPDKIAGGALDTILYKYVDHYVSDFQKNLRRIEYPLDDSNPNIQPEVVTATLYPFQRKTVGWMLWREGVTLSSRYSDRSLRKLQESSDYMLSIPLTIDSNTVIHYNPISRSVSMEPKEWLSNENAGILTDEMGLGKTVELLALIAHHHPSCNSNPSHSEFYERDFSCCNTDPESYDEVVSKRQKKDSVQLKRSKATLIIVPSPILAQWISEVRKHAPNIRIFVYEGFSKADKDEERDDFDEFDIVLTTFDVLTKEVHVAKPESERSRRQPQKYKFSRSILITTLWWRVCVDEAQNVDGKKNSTECAWLIPTLHKWVSSGTPIGKSGLADLLQLFQFLKIEPFYSNPKSWNNFITSCNFPSAESPTVSHVFPALRNYIHRNSKADVQHELKLPAQHQRCVKVELSDVEKHYYDSLVGEYLKEVEIRTKNGEIMDAARKASWLLRFRQTSCHVQIGAQNQQVFGKSLRTIDDILCTMLRGCESQILTHEWYIFQAQITLAQIAEFEQDYATSLEIFTQMLPKVESVLENVTKVLESLSSSVDEPNELVDVMDDENDELGESPQSKQKRPLSKAEELTVIKQRLLQFRQLQHQVVFFIACNHHMLGNEEEENQMYEVAEELRKMLLKPFRSNCVTFIEYFAKVSEIRDAAINQGAVAKAMQDEWIKSIKSDDKKGLDVFLMNNQEVKQALTGGMEFKNALNDGRAYNEQEDVEAMIETLNNQSEAMQSWRNIIVQGLLTPIENKVTSFANPLSSESSGEKALLEARKSVPSTSTASDTTPTLGAGQPEQELTEFDTGLILQEKIAYYQEIYSRAIEDRRELLCGVRYNFEITANKRKTKRSLRSIKINEYDGDEGDEMIVDGGVNESSSLEAVREFFKLKRNQLPMKALVNNIAKSGNGLLQKKLNQEIDRQMGKLILLDRDKILFSKLFNSRIRYYNQLQKLSDSVTVPEFAGNRILEMKRNAAIASEESEKNNLAKEISRKRYLLNLMRRREGDSSLEDPNDSEESEEKVCLVCHEVLLTGFITICAHIYCSRCVSWVKKKGKCASCMKTLGNSPLSQFSNTVVSTAEDVTRPIRRVSKSQDESKKASSSSAIVWTEQPWENIELNGSYGTKFDLIIKQVIYFRRMATGREQSPPKFLIFSQWAQVLEIIGRGLSENNTNWLKLESNSIETKEKTVIKFRDDPDIAVFMLNAKSQSSGLTLVAANHVILVEPVLNHSLEVQATGRVHRIGQSSETFVWRYMVEDSIEEKIYNLAAMRQINNTAKEREGRVKFEKGELGWSESVETEDLNILLASF